MKPEPKTQCERILAYLRKHKRATNMELATKCGMWIACPWRRITDLEDAFFYAGHCNFIGQISDREIIHRSTIKTKSGKRVTQYELVRLRG